MDPEKMRKGRMEHYQAMRGLKFHGEHDQKSHGGDGGSNPLDDAQTESHLDNWLESQYSNDRLERAAVKRGVRRLLEDYPELAKSNTWGEIVNSAINAGHIDTDSSHRSAPLRQVSDPWPKKY